MALGTVNVGPVNVDHNEFATQEQLNEKANVDLSNVESTTLEQAISDLGIGDIPDWAAEPTKPNYSAEEISIPEASQESLEGEDVLESLSNLKTDIFMMEQLVNASGNLHAWQKYQTGIGVINTGNILVDSDSSTTDYPSVSRTITIFTEYTPSTDGESVTIGGTISTESVMNGKDYSEYQGKYFVLDTHADGDVVSTFYGFKYNSKGQKFHSNVSSSTYRAELYIYNVDTYGVGKFMIGVVTSEDENAYTEGVMYADQISYVYVGVISESLAKAETGSYTGTGGSGSSSKTTIAFEGEPYVVFVDKYTIVRGMTSLSISSGFSTTTVTVSLSGNTLTMYANNAANQLNTSGTTYYYAALC